jgi:hypothetical protein
MNADLFLALFLLVGGFVVWLASRGGGPPSSATGALLVLLFVGAGCSGSQAPPSFVPPDVSEATAPDLGPDQEAYCSEVTMSFSDYIVALPSVFRIRYRWNFDWCIRASVDFRGFEGRWYFIDWATSFSDWSKINQIILLVDDRPLAWVTETGETGFDPTYDIAPYLTFGERKDGEPGSRVCLPVEVDLDAWTSRERVDFEYNVVQKICPNPLTHEPKP